MILLAVLGMTTAAIDWRIAATWAWTAPWVGVWLGATALALAVGAFRPRLRNVVSIGTAASLYAVPIVGAIIRWHVVPSRTALIGDAAYQTQLAGDFLLRGVDPYGADYARVGLGAAPWGESFPSPAT